ncbi:sodium:solute symporter [cf. Phormidesmis sp. LEGE 11477]|uniref:sodium:solute symporter family protein n=1 Tax=cf. Phormidesmis sp. LEGE 11477 TaxID=1828680 RepID=UPI0018821BF4|nr:sodium:solute symporter [cf. Phormidesmis sp. LEGE 11477]MBE9061391.1 sodium:solute symporter [cf. Phormidesmis sp. LEGE 11477]
MLDIELVPNPSLAPAQGVLMMLLLGAISLGVAFYVKSKLVKNTHDFIVAGRKLGFGFGVAGLISVWTWAMAVMMSAAMTYNFGLSGLWWFTVPNGLAVIAVIPFAKQLREKMPHGYTMGEFVSSRFDNAKLARIVVTVGLIFGSLIEIIINLKGTSLVISTVFGMSQTAVAIVAIAIVLAYSMLGGLWASMCTSTLTTLFITVPASVVLMAVLSYLGGPTPLWEAVADKGPELLSVTRADVPAAFGITLALGLLTATLAGQSFWQIVWGLKAKEVGRSFLWAGAWFYPIPICLGILGLVGIALNVDLATNLNNDAAAVGPFVISHIGLPSWLVYSYVFVILSACYSTMDGALASLSSLAAIDVIKPIAPQIQEKSLLKFTRTSMLIAAVIALGVVISGVDFVTIVLTTYAIRTAILVPLMLAIFWRKMTAGGFIWGTVAAIVVGMPLRMALGELPGTLIILAISTVVPIVMSLPNTRLFDYDSLKQVKDL